MEGTTRPAAGSRQRTPLHTGFRVHGQIEDASRNQLPAGGERFSLVPGMISDQDFHESRKPWINKAHGVSPLRPATPPVGHRESKKLVHDMLVHRTSIVTCRSMPRLPVGCCFPEAHSSSEKNPCPPVSYANQTTLLRIPNRWGHSRMRQVQPTYEVASASRGACGGGRGGGVPPSSA